ncbi:Hypothetical protein GbCGDNIH2_2210 [Granulibacter bethesdensis]|uniref:Uncharacterized protein n=1 Tax=Granulibacter bethesdensis (strain ATCC BAA-1260 / CGDNIH1) TaxID=391165 RepID=Q0BPZ4_GRABC|nr:Hypothetical protein GbCGDNIH1_2210 [Granulibacter bethesdensis CGDNIH1]APG30751.1 Hypothetical protein GbCGDNIH2_2210 [Granulibacter bethesdensis]APH60555.1 Hypothetical protein GbCGDNIH7_2210 [Granulibacter bethesdensis]APH65672.1 Hypothetical protein GbCGDNIH1I4_2210 [Granulibacter bethesdensis]
MVAVCEKPCYRAAVSLMAGMFRPLGHRPSGLVLPGFGQGSKKAGGRNIFGDNVRWTRQGSRIRPQQACCKQEIEIR